MSTIKILLVDDHKIVRDGIKSYLENDTQFEIIGEAADGNEALAFLAHTAPDIMLTDISMDGMDGFELSSQTLEKYPEIKIVVLSMLNEHQHIRRMLDAGVLGYVLKTADEEEVKKALLSVSQGNAYYSKEVTQTVMSSIARRKSMRKTSVYGQMPLTEREKEVLQLILKEFSNTEIANSLFISPRTVDAHKRNLLEKTGAKNVAGLVLYAINNGLFEG